MHTLQKLFLRVVLSLMSFPRLLHWLRSSQWIGLMLSKTRSNESHHCLERSLLEIASLTRAGIKARLVIGVKKEGFNLLAHAWVEKEGEAFDEHDGFKKLGAL